MTECEKLRSDLKAYLDGQLSPAARIALRLHLNRCESCRKELEDMRLLGTRMRSADSLEMSDALRTRILASVPTTPPTATVRMLPKWREKPVLIWGASASAVLAWFMLYPALNDYQNHVSRSATATSNARQIGMGAQLYVQDYDSAKERIDLHIKAGNGRAATAQAAAGNSYSRPFPSVNGLAPLVGNGNGNPVGELHTERGTLSPQQIDTSVDYYKSPPGAKPPPYVFSEVEPIRLKDKVVHVGRESGVRRWVFPRTFAASKSTDRAAILLAQNFSSTNGRHEKFETDPALSGNAQTVKHIGSSSKAPHSVLQSYDTGSSVADDLPTERQVHREASLTIEVANAEQQSESVERLVKESKGYVAQNQLTTAEDNTRQSSLTCKVPVDQFDTVMGQIARLGLLKGKTLSGEDITEKVSDEQETGHVLRADIVTTEEKLKTRRRHSETVRDEETLRRLRIRVAQSQARLKMLTRLGTLSEITVELDEKPKNPAPAEVKPSSPFMQEVSGTGQAAAHSFLMALRLPIQLLVWIVVYSPLWALLFIAYRRMTR